MYAGRSVIFLAAALALLPACAKKKLQSGGSQAAVTGEVAKVDAFLAYEHAIRIELPEDTISAHIDALHDACASARFGTCSLLSVAQHQGRHPDGEIVVRVVPAAVEPMVKMAGEGGSLAARTTSAEDLADAVAENGREGDRLERQRTRLEAFQTRKDLSVTDMLALSKELAAIEVRLESVADVSARQKQRVETNRLSISFSAPSVEESRIGTSMKTLWDSFVEGIADALEYLGYSVPFLAIGLPLLLLLRLIWRKATRPRA